MPVQTRVFIARQKQITSEIFHLDFKNPGLSKPVKPGQFFQIKIEDTQTYLPRPFSAHRVKNGEVSILYRIKGRGTKALSEKKPGQTFQVLGPLGNGFTLGKNSLDSFNKIFVVAGGLGIAPVLFLLDRIMAHTDNRPEVFFGACTKEELILDKELKATGCVIHHATDDCSFGHGGKITTLLEKKLGESKLENMLIYACGPEAMYRSLQKTLKKFPRVTVEALFERIMGCGFGICNSCSIMTRQGMKKVCIDGPAFNLADIIFE